jgi:hypothetical protein
MKNFKSILLTCICSSRCVIICNIKLFSLTHLFFIVWYSDQATSFGLKDHHQALILIGHRSKLLSKFWDNLDLCCISIKAWWWSLRPKHVAWSEYQTIKRDVLEWITLYCNFSKFLYCCAEYSVRAVYRSGCAAAGLLELRVGIPPRAWIVSCVTCCQVNHSSRGVLMKTVCRSVIFKSQRWESRGLLILSSHVVT